MPEHDVSEIFDPAAWTPVPDFEDLTDLTYHRAVDHGTVRIAFDRPEVRNAFRPHTVDELLRTLDHARMSSDVGCVLLTGNGPSPRDGGWAFCSGGTSGSAGAPATSTRGPTARTEPTATAGPTATARGLGRPPTTSTPRGSGGCTSWSASG